MKCDTYNYLKGDLHMSNSDDQKPVMSQISLKIPRDLIDRYDKYARSKSNPRSHYMREALVEYIERREKEKER
jgi:metal-responsive CopG/Arc/MetJ family transcriptional regulator